MGTGLRYGQLIAAMPWPTATESGLEKFLDLQDHRLVLCSVHTVACHVALGVEQSLLFVIAQRAHADLGTSRQFANPHTVIFADTLPCS